MRAGELRVPVVIQRREALRSESGAAGERWTEYAETWAAFEALGGTERDMLGVQVAQQGYRLRLRWVAGVAPGMRVRWVDGGTERLLQIEGVMNVDQRNRELQLVVREVSTQSGGLRVLA